ncbi:MAG: CRISPR-associated endonuclease Cas2 [Deltaproteobacteria bacterium]|nr:CRISPR-associated endonuclease Cas2 [Deltaproteobacteria bacterium]
MWIIVLFDLPTKTKIERKRYTLFRKRLMKGGFSMMQYSVYMRHCASDENARVHVHRVKNNLPPDGEVRIIKITDKQFARIEVFYGKKQKPTEKPPAQMELF